MDANKAIEVLGQAASGVTTVDDDLKQAAGMGQKALQALVALKIAHKLVFPFLLDGNSEA